MLSRLEMEMSDPAENAATAFPAILRYCRYFIQVHRTRARIGKIIPRDRRRALNLTHRYEGQVRSTARYIRRAMPSHSIAHLHRRPAVANSNDDLRICDGFSISSHPVPRPTPPLACVNRVTETREIKWPHFWGGGLEEEILDGGEAGLTKVSQIDATVLFSTRSQTPRVG